MAKKLVLFDCDGVLINSEEVGYNILSDMLARIGLVYTREEYVELLSGVAYEQFLENLRADHLERMGAPLPEGFEAELQEKVHEAEKQQLKAIDGVKQLLKNLRDNNIPYAVCSNSGADNLLYKLKKTGLYDDFVPYIFSRSHVDNPKPAPDIYEHAAKIFGVDPKDCLVVEDSMTGTMAGVAAGMNVIGFVGEAHRDDSEADLLVRAGAKMIALSPQQVWEHVADATGANPRFRSDRLDFRP